MGFATMITTAAVIGLSAQAAEPGRTSTSEVTVCMGNGNLKAVPVARGLASQMFAGIGVTIDWRNPGACPSEAILIDLTDGTPENLRRGSLAYALPYEGVHIRVFCDRIESYPPNLVPRVLAHVLVHEITHILQGEARHSESGVMKAHWNPDDFTTMMSQHLRFEDQDIDLIRRGLAVRAAGTTVARNAVPESVTAQ